MKRIQNLVVVFVLLLCKPSLAVPVDIPVSVPVGDQARLGIVVATLESQTVNSSVEAIIRSVDPLPLATLNSDLLAATAAAAASESELRRVAGLAAQDRSASQQALELARARAAADRAAVSLLHRRLELEWGAGFARQADQFREKLIEDVSSGTAALLRADAPERPGGVAGRVTVELPDDVEIVATELLGLSGTADQRMQTTGLYCVVRGDDAKLLRPGRVLGGRIEIDAAMTGVVLPRSALIRADGRVWVYVRTDADEFVRREVSGGLPVTGGWYVADDFEPGIEIVVEGAGSMASFEHADELVEED